MKDQMESQRNLIEYYEDARQSFVTKMQSEEDERSNLKFKIAAFVIHEVTYSTPGWFKNYFLTHIAKNDHDNDVTDEKIIKVENAFYDVVADYLIKMESEVEYVKKVLSPFSDDESKKKFWEPIVFDAFLIVGIYFTPTLNINNSNDKKMREKEGTRKVNSRYKNYDHSNYDRNVSFRLHRGMLVHGMNSR